MILHAAELDFLTAWAREEKTPDPFSLPAHRLQAAHQVPGVLLIRAIKAWARAEGRRDEDIFTRESIANPPWPWSDDAEFRKRFDEIMSAAQEHQKT
jgi:hypothetical protein